MPLHMTGHRALALSLSMNQIFVRAGADAPRQVGKAPPPGFDLPQPQSRGSQPGPGQPVLQERAGPPSLQTLLAGGLPTGQINGQLLRTPPHCMHISLSRALYLLSDVVAALRLAFRAQHVAYAIFTIFRPFNLHVHCVPAAVVYLCVTLWHALAGRHRDK